jgi:hypothetical protein
MTLPPEQLMRAIGFGKSWKQYRGDIRKDSDRP